jgi:hypothetical protein
MNCWLWSNYTKHWAGAGSSSRGSAGMACLTTPMAAPPEKKSAANSWLKCGVLIGFTGVERCKRSGFSKT